MKYKKESVKDFVERTSNEALEQLDKFFESPENIKEFIDFKSQFWQYSQRNQLLISKQYTGAKAVAPYKKWQEQDVNVEKGEKGIQILVPSERKSFLREDENRNKRIIPLSKATPQEREKISNNEIKVNKHLQFVKGHVFDIQQTNTPQKEYPKLLQQMQGEVPHYNNRMDNLKELVQAVGVDEVKSSSDSNKGTQGFYAEKKDGSNFIQLNKNNSESENVNTMVHEVAHAVLHNSDVAGSSYPPEQKEFQAEMTALIVGNYLGVQSEDNENSIRYIHGYANDLNSDKKMNLMKDVNETAYGFINALNGNDANDIYMKANQNKNENYIKPTETSKNSMLRNDQLYTVQDANYLTKEMNSSVSYDFIYQNQKGINVSSHPEYIYAPSESPIKQNTLIGQMGKISEFVDKDEKNAIQKEAHIDKGNNRNQLRVVKDNESEM